MLKIISFICGLLFGLGLLLSGMSNPAKVQSFLDLAGAWDPSLAFVMLGAIGSAYGLFLLAKNRQHALITCAVIRLPSQNKIEKRLIIGSLLFGLGWGLAGICPGPGIVALMTGQADIMIFVLAMLAGIALYEFIERNTKKEHSAHEDA